MTNIRLPRWTQSLEGKEYLVLVVPQEWAEQWASALSYAEYEGKEWVVRRDNWLVGCEPGYSYLAPDFADVEAPEWVCEQVA